MPRIATIVTLIVLFGLTIQAGILHAQEADSTETTVERITNLVEEGKFTEALELAKEHLLTLKADSDSKPYEIIDFELLISTLSQVLAFPESNQQEMALAWRLYAEVDSLYAEGDFKTAIPKIQEQLEIIRRHLGEEHIEFAASLNMLGPLLYLQGDYEAGIRNVRDALEICKKLLGSEHPEVAQSLNNLAVFHYSREEYEEAEKLLKEALEMKIKLLGEEDITLQETLNNIAQILADQGKYEEAETYARKALEIGKREWGEESPELIVTRNNLAGILEDAGKFSEAEQLHRKNLDICRRVLGDRHPETALCLHNLTSSVAAKGNLQEAEALLREAIAIRKEKLGEEHPYTLSSIEALARILTAYGKFDESEKTIRELLSIKRRKYGDEHTEVAFSQHNFALLLYNRGNYGAAEALIRESLEIFRKNPEYESLNIAASMSTLAELLNTQGNYAESIELQREVLRMRREMLGEKHVNIAASMYKLGVALSNMGEADEAERLYREALSMRRELLEEDDLYVALNLGDLATLLLKQKQNAEAVELMREGLEIYNRLLGEQHQTVAQLKNFLGVMLLAVEDQEGAEKCWREALQVQRRMLGAVNRNTISTLLNYGAYQYAIGDFVTADSLLSEAAEGYDAARKLAGSGIEKARFQQSPYPMLAATRLKQEKYADAWNSVESASGRVLADLMMAAGQRSLSPEEKSEEERLRRELTKAEKELAVYRTSSQTDPETSTEVDQEEVHGKLLTAQAAWSRFQQEITGKYPVTEGQAFPLERVQKEIQPDEAILGWLDIITSRYGGGKRDAWVYVIRNHGPVHWIPLELAGEDAGKLQKKLRDELEWPTREESVDVQNICQAIFKERIQPAISNLEGVRSLVVVPSGPMLGIPVDLLIDDDGLRFSDRFVISYVPSATIYAWLRERDNAGTGSDRQKMLLVGDPPFCEEHLEAMNHESTEPKPASEVTIDVATVRSVLSGNRDALASMSRLPASRSEVKAISALSEEAHMLIGPEASEQNLDGLASGGDLADFDVIHVATHALVDSRNPDKSALILSQVNLPDAFDAVAKGDRVYNGMVTVKDIIRGWKLNADLVTLSACETGLGLKVSGEGFVGFMHAFLQAGARSLVVSLWKVDDRATSLLMQRFYRNYLGKDGHSLTKAESLQEAKNWLRTYKDEGGEVPFTHPAYWSGFILVGARE
jgi:CHAT domain-containing protein/Flp pilus assembly protein TadD